MQNSSEKPILFIELDGEQEQNFKINSDAISLLHSINDDPIAIIGIVGPQRTGKSFLANRLLKRMDGFAIGPTTNPCTKGIWLWSKPLIINRPNQSPINCIIMDTEGLFSLSRNIQQDMKLFSLSLLISSYLIYNSMGQIDETAIENLSLVTELSNVFMSRETDASNLLNKEKREFNSFLPSFMWVLRDFSLDLKSISSKEYLEGCLIEEQETNEGVKKKNLIRRAFKQYFITRDCFTLVRPIIEEEKLSKIELQAFESLRPQFKQEANDLIEKVINNVSPKMFNGKILSTKMFVDFVTELVNSFNNDSKFYVDSAAERVIFSQLRKSSEQVYSKAITKIENSMGLSQLPIEEFEYYTLREQILKSASKELQLKIKDCANITDIIRIEDNLHTRIDEELQMKKQINEKLSASLCDENLSYIVVNFSLPFIKDVSSIRESLTKELKVEFLKYLHEYGKHSKGPSKYLKVYATIPEFIFDIFDKIIKQIKTLYEAELKQIKVYLEDSRRGEENLRKFIQGQEELMKEHRKEAEYYKRESEKITREFEKFKKLKSREEQNWLEHLDSVQSKLNKSTENLATLKLDLSQKEIEIKKKVSEINDYKRQIIGLKKTIEDQDGSIKELQKNSFENKNPYFSENTIREITKIQEEIEQLRIAARDDSLLKTITVFKHELEEKNSIIINLKETEKTKFKEYSATYKATQKELHDKFKAMLEQKTKSVSELKLALDEERRLHSSEEVFEKDAEISKLTFMNKELSSKIKQHEERHSKLDDSHQTLLEVIQSLIPKLDNIIQLENQLEEFRVQIANLTTKKSSLEGAIDDLLSVFREGSKKIAGTKYQADTFKQCLEKLDHNHKEQVINIFKECGIQIPYYKK